VTGIGERIVAVPKIDQPVDRAGSSVDDCGGLLWRKIDLRFDNRDRRGITR